MWTFEPCGPFRTPPGYGHVTNRKPVLGINVGTDRAITWYGARQPEKGGVPGGDEKVDRLRRNDVFACLPTGYEKTEIVKQCRANENGGLTTFLCFVDDEVPETLENRNRFDSRAGVRAFLGQTSILGHERRADVHHWVATDRPIATISVGCRTTRAVNTPPALRVLDIKLLGGGNLGRRPPGARFSQAISIYMYENECGKVKHTALPADQPPCCSALQNCMSPKGYRNGDGHHPTLCIRARET
ncbi:hypothetical protein Bbelb_113570 [Branchiostoma belcheri]|nr:hypothetical protein Bbelb_113570 [Branchiostoma belcheri]